VWVIPPRQEKVIPAFAKLHDFLVNRYLRGARETIGLSDLPDGKAWYAFRARMTPGDFMPAVLS
jgi:uncharacterized protein (DUF885 family)